MKWRVKNVQYSNLHLFNFIFSLTFYILHLFDYIFSFFRFLNNFRFWPKTNCDPGAQLVWRHMQARRDLNRCANRCHKLVPDSAGRDRTVPPHQRRHLRITQRPAGSRGRWERGIACCVIRTFRVTRSG